MAVWEHDLRVDQCDVENGSHLDVAGSGCRQRMSVQADGSGSQ